MFVLGNIKWKETDTKQNKKWELIYSIWNIKTGNNFALLISFVCITMHQYYGE